jgi:uncharacterized protein YdhG (YjbR/CyaY superfamily)
MAFASHEEYFASVPSEARRLLESIQAKVEAVLPGTSRCISYNMPAFKHERVFFYFAAFKKHIGIYPPVTQDARLMEELAPYRGEKGNLSFPRHEPLPIELIGRVALALSREYERKRSAGA